MAKIPVLEEGSAAPTLPGARQSIPTSPDDFGAATGRVLENIGRQAQQVGGQAIALSGQQKREAERVQLEDDKTSAAEGYNELSSYYTTADDKYLIRQEKEAVGVFDVARVESEEERRQIRANLPNEQAQKFFDLKAETAQIAWLNGINNHEIKEAEIHRINTHKATRVNAIDSALRKPFDGGAIRQAEADIITSTKEINRGSGDEVIKASTAEQVSKLYEEVLNLQMAQNPAAAEQFYSLVKDKIDPSKHAAFEKVIKEENIDFEARNVVEEAIDVVEDPEKQREFVKKELKGKGKAKTLESALSKLKDEQSQQRQFEAEKQDDIRDEAFNKIQKSKSLTESLTYLKPVKDSQDNRILEAYARSKHTVKKEKVVTNLLHLNNAYIEVDTFDTTTEALIMKYSPTVSEGDMKDLLQYHRDGGVIGGLKESRLKTLYEFMTGAKIEGEEDVSKYMTTREFIVDHIKATGKNPTDDELVTVMTKALIKTPSTGLIFKVEGMTLAEAVQKGQMNQWIAALEVPEDPDVSFNKQFIIDRLVAENARRERAGENLIHIDENTVKRYYLTQKVGLVPVAKPVTTTAIATPQPKAPPAPAVAPAPPATPPPTAPPVELPPYMQSAGRSQEERDFFNQFVADNEGNVPTEDEFDQAVQDAKDEITRQQEAEKTELLTSGGRFKLSTPSLDILKAGAEAAQSAIAPPAREGERPPEPPKGAPAPTRLGGREVPKLTEAEKKAREDEQKALR